MPNKWKVLCGAVLSRRNGDYEMKPSQQSSVDPSTIAGGEDYEAGIFLASPQEIIDFNVGIAVVPIFHVSAFAKKRIRLIEKQDRMTILRRIENTVDIFLGLANIFRDDGIQIDPVEVFPEAVGQSLSRDKTPPPIFAGE